MNLPRIAIVTAAAYADVTRICQAMGLGTSYFTRKLCARDQKHINTNGAETDNTHETPPTHWMVQDMSAQASEQEMWQGMAQEADLPPISGVWGEDGVISAQDAQAALAFGNLGVYTAAGEDNPTAWRDGILLGRGLMFVPDEPI